MATSLRDVLRKKAAQYDAEAKTKEHAISEWRASVSSLYDQLLAYLKKADPDGTIQTHISQTEVNEPGFGRYDMPRLNLQAFGRWVGLIPKARTGIRKASPPQLEAPTESTGRVDMTNEIRRFVFYRFANEEWKIHDTATKEGPQPLTPERFEYAVLAYFK